MRETSMSFTVAFRIITTKIRLKMIPISDRTFSKVFVMVKLFVKGEFNSITNQSLQNKACGGIRMKTKVPKTKYKQVPPVR